jgi:hypothetical protein
VHATSLDTQSMVMNATGTMLERLGAPGPQTDAEEALMLFGRLAGSWVIDKKEIAGDGTTQEFVADWHFGWTLEGRAVQDVLVTRTPGGAVVGYGSTIRSYDKSRALWWCVWQDPLAGQFAVLAGRPAGDRIVLDGAWTPDLREGSRFRWTFSEITADSFRWEGHVAEGERPWILQEEMQARRRR